MANSLDVRVVEDGRRNAVVKIVGVADTANIVQAPLITLAQFLNNDGGNVVFNGLRLLSAEYAITNGFGLLFEWDGNTKQPMCALADSGSFDGRRDGGYVPDRKASGYNGSINLTSKGFFAGNTYVFTVVLRMQKMYGL